MKTQTFHLELITPCFCGGANPQEQAEIRAPSIRGQLRWWFRVLGGFKSLGEMPVRKQEEMIFGSTAGEDGGAGKLVVRVSAPQPKSSTANADDLGAGMNTPLGYALFPLRAFGDSDGKRGMLVEGTKFSLSIVWRGRPEDWDSIGALVGVWGHLGALGFRSRRTVGALCLTSPNVALQQAIEAFAAVSGIQVRELSSPSIENWRSASAALLKWYRSWRQHGQMNQTWHWTDRKKKHLGGRWVPISQQQKQDNRSQPGFHYARRDHNEGLDVQGTGAPNPDSERPAGAVGQTFRPALGLPIIQFFSSLGNSRGPIPRGRATVNWNWDWNAQQNKGEGRFASPVLLRPHRDASGKWHALVIFVDARRWPNDPATGRPKQVFLNGEPREVSLELYEKMKGDQALKPFPP
jgi:CRISPR-associated protein Cmr1